MRRRGSKRKATAGRRGVATGTDDSDTALNSRPPAKYNEGDKVGRTAENQSQQAPGALPATPNSGRKYNRVLKRLPRPDSALGLASPKSSVTACHECRRIEKAHKWCLRSIKCGSGSSRPRPVSDKLAEAVTGVPMQEPGQVSRPTKSQGSGNLNELLATTARQSQAAFACAASSTSLASGSAAGPESQRPLNKQCSGSGANVPQIYHDPFSNMRLDIDNMSYEDLLALQEQIGYVSTGLSEEELVKSRKIATYGVKRRKATKHKEVDSKCSICQEEYRNGDEMGSLKCEHSYHVICIDQWLREKNWCPTCKAAATPA